MYKEKKISIILPTFNEKDSIKKVIKDFEDLGIVDEILVINNNAVSGTSEELIGTSAVEIKESVQGYGSAIIRGFKEANGDIMVVCEPDDTFLAKDIFKFLAYSEDVDFVYGSRTFRELIWSGANMGWFLRFGNWAVSKLMEVLFNTNSLTDVGCTYRLVHKKAIMELLPAFMVKTNFFGPEMMVRSYLSKYKCIQIPVVYKARIGKSSVTGNFGKAFILGIKMILLLFILRLKIDKTVLKYLK
jgi:glycosyltransferase involved in cell wall biosynthesis